ncbi:apolipoprotein N-acyltransferase [Roseibium sediminis]|uniref:apolipoprotein N-acyltransferase n=1 Tax=Roseibium sediminis TaxID=1775174 RepID=UPI00123C99E2|nr:apolipoprotein N-acyltransferase [Roseibium sediminis]
MNTSSLAAIFMVFPNTCLLAWGWRRSGLALVAGVAAAFSLPPYHLIPLLLIAFPFLVWLMDGAMSSHTMSAAGRMWKGFRLGWVFGFGYFLASFWWIGSAFLVEADRFAWMLPFAVLAMPIGLALFTGCAVAVAALFWHEGWGRIFLLAASLAVFDWLRGHVLTGFPWNAFGYGVSGSLVLSQTASLVGIYGLGFLTVLLSCAPAILSDPARLSRKLRPFAVLCLVGLGLAGFGYHRLNVAEDPEVSDVDVRIIQPSIPQDEKWLPENRDLVFNTLLDMSQQPLGGNARVGQRRIIVWPESAIPFLLTREPGALFRIAQALNDQTTLATGAVRADMTGDAAQFFNSIYFIDHTGAVLDVYDKVHLVPFGEYLPLEELLERFGISALVDAPEGFQAGYRRKVLELAGFPPLLPLICYEAIFPQYGRGEANRPDWLLNVTNDAWFGKTPGPYQHLAQSVMRSIEQGIPLIRAANTGISTVVDSKGRVVSRLEIYETGVVDEKIPGKMQSTLYGSYGDKLFVSLVLIAAVFAMVGKYNLSSRPS